MLGSFGIAFAGRGPFGGIGSAFAGGGVAGSFGPIAAALEVVSITFGTRALAGSGFGGFKPCFVMVSNCARLLA